MISDILLLFTPTMMPYATSHDCMSRPSRQNTGYGGDGRGMSGPCAGDSPQAPAFFVEIGAEGLWACAGLAECSAGTADEELLGLFTGILKPTKERNPFQHRKSWTCNPLKGSQNSQ